MRGAPSFAKRAPPRIAYNCYSEHLTVIPSAVEESETDVSAPLNMTKKARSARNTRLTPLHKGDSMRQKPPLN